MNQQDPRNPQKQPGKDERPENPGKHHNPQHGDNQQEKKDRSDQNR